MYKYNFFICCVYYVYCFIVLTKIQGNKKLFPTKTYKYYLEAPAQKKTSEQKKREIKLYKTFFCARENLLLFAQHATCIFAAGVDCENHNDSYVETWV